MTTASTEAFPRPSHSSSYRVALVGNPNSGKSTLFNALTGMNQRTGNFPGVTVDKKTGYFKVQATNQASVSFEIVDLPGTYSLFPKSLDEQVTFDVLLDEQHAPDIVLIVLDASNLKRNLLLASQVMDTRLPCVMVFNMMDVAEKNGIQIQLSYFEKEWGIPVVGVDARHKQGIEDVKNALLRPGRFNKNFLKPESFLEDAYLNSLASSPKPYYQTFLKQRNAADKDTGGIYNHKQFDQFESRDTLLRFHEIRKIITETHRYAETRKDLSLTDRMDRWATHPIWGFVIFFFILFCLFQSIFYLAEYPMNWIENLFLFMTDISRSHLPEGMLTDLWCDGILAGISGVAVFIPQIALLFGFIALLEDSGYMARVSFIMDRIMRKAGLNGRSVIPLISGVACAVPAIMSTRTISNFKERMITIMITPFISCSARLPVYTLLIALLYQPDENWGFIQKRGLILMGLYLLGFITAITFAFLLKWLVKAREKSYFIMEMPIYRIPQGKTVALTIYEKVRIFLWDAGKIIVAISIILWFLSGFGPGDQRKAIEDQYASMGHNLPDSLQAQKNAALLECSYAGILGKKLEPIIAPLGFDWKMGISLITSFAAREVFVGTMATIYSAGDDDNSSSIREKMANDRRSDGSKTYNAATCFSLLIFYAYALQCISTMAIVYRETKHRKWPLLQLIVMTGFAYLSSLFVYQMLS